MADAAGLLALAAQLVRRTAVPNVAENLRICSAIETKSVIYRLASIRKAKVSQAIPLCPHFIVNL
jgi:hypothetical protein